jgi:hypothetical protein
MQEKEKYAGLIKTPDSGWWLSLSRSVFDAWDMPEGAVRDGILSVAQEMGVLHLLGPSTMTSAEAYMAAQKVIGLEVNKDDPFEGFVPKTDRGRDFINGTGEFSTEEEQ